MSATLSKCAVLLMALLVLSLTLATHIVDAQQCNSSSIASLPSSTTVGAFNMSAAAFPNMTNWPVAQWSVAGSSVAPFVAPVTLGGVTYPAGSWLWWGTQQLVQLSSDYGQTWSQQSYGADYPGSSDGNAQCAHRNTYNRFYEIGNVVSENTTAPVPAFIWASNNGTEGSWYNLSTAATQAAWKGRVLYQSQCVVDKQDNVYSLGQSDIWRSADQGVTWSNITTSSMYSPRTSASSTIWTASAGDVMVMLGGEAINQAWLNDVWASQTGGISWIQVTSAAPWTVRGGAALASTNAGVMVMQGGQGYVGSAMNWWTDAWVSLNGGVTWTQLSYAAGPQISYRAAIVDPLGYFSVFGGQSTSYSWTTGGAKSSLSLYNIQQWSSAVNGTLTIPAGYTPCTPFFNLVSSGAAPTAGSSSGMSAVSGVSSSSASAASAASAASSSSAARGNATTAASAVSSSSAPAASGNGTTAASAVSSSSASTPSGNGTTAASAVSSSSAASASNITASSTAAAVVASSSAAVLSSAASTAAATVVSSSSSAGSIVSPTSAPTSAAASTASQASTASTPASSTAVITTPTAASSTTTPLPSPSSTATVVPVGSSSGRSVPSTVNGALRTSSTGLISLTFIALIAAVLVVA